MPSRTLITGTSLAALFLAVLATLLRPWADPVLLAWLWPVWALVAFAAGAALLTLLMVPAAEPASRTSLRRDDGPQH